MSSSHVLTKPSELLINVHEHLRCHCEVRTPTLPLRSTNTYVATAKYEHREVRTPTVPPRSTNTYVTTAKYEHLCCHCEVRTPMLPLRSSFCRCETASRFRQLQRRKACLCKVFAKCCESAIVATIVHFVATKLCSCKSSAPVRR